MAEKINATCIVCGKGYHKCISCHDTMRLHPWQTHTDTSEHYKIYQILHGYAKGVYSKEEAKEKLQLVDLSDINTFKPEVQAYIYRIINDTTESVSEEKIVKSKPKVVRKKKKSTNVVETDNDTVPTLN